MINIQEPHQELTPKAFEAFLTDRVNETFNYGDVKNCCFAQFARSMGVDIKSCSSHYYIVNGSDDDYKIPDFIHIPLNECMANSDSNIISFGSVLEYFKISMYNVI